MPMGQPPCDPVYCCFILDAGPKILLQTWSLALLRLADLHACGLVFEFGGFSLVGKYEWAPGGKLFPCVAPKARLEPQSDPSQLHFAASRCLLVKW
jgi:hypothetical protein